MVAAVIEGGFDADVEGRQGAFFQCFDQTFFNRREVVLGNGAADDDFLEDEIFFAGLEPIQTSPIVRRRRSISCVGLGLPANTIVSR